MSNDDTDNPWATLATEEALRRVRHSLYPRWEAWTVDIYDGSVMWCARRLSDGAVAHGDSPARLLSHIGDADACLIEELQRQPRREDQR